MLTIEQADYRISSRAHTRGMERIYNLDAVTTTDVGEELHAALSVFVYHDKDRKCFRLSINRVAIGTITYRMAITFGKGQPVPDKLFRPTPRYSAKALEEAFAEALEYVEPNLPALLEWAAGAIKEV